MLTARENELLTRVGPGTPCGEMMRRYWHPVAGVAQLDRKPVRLVRLLGENFVLYRDRGGRIGLLGELCPHRKISLSYGIPQGEGLRCCYHGWVFDATGQCLEQPAEPPESTFKDRVRADAYPVQVMGGLVWVYIGPEPVPVLPRYDVFAWENAWRDIAIVELNCNWLQCVENSVDLTHVDYLHGLYYDYILETQGKPPRRAHETRFGGKRQVDIGFEQFAFGIKKRRRVEGAAEDDPEWRQGSNPLVFPYMTRAGGRGSIQLRVPIDDTHTLCILYSCYRPDDGLPVPHQSMIPVYDVPLYNADGDLKTDWITGQDIMAWLMQGPIMDRTTERLGASDRGVIYYRQLLFEQIERVREGEDPLGVMRNREDDLLIELKPDDERGPAESVRYMDNHWHQFSPIYEEAKALMLRHRNAAVTVQAGGAG